MFIPRKRFDNSAIFDHLENVFCGGLFLFMMQHFPAPGGQAIKPRESPMRHKKNFLQHTWLNLPVIFLNRPDRFHPWIQIIAVTIRSLSNTLPVLLTEIFTPHPLTACPCPIGENIFPGPILQSILTPAANRPLRASLKRSGL